MDTIDPSFPVFGFYYRRYAPFKSFGRMPPPFSLGQTNFEGDDRGPSTSLNVGARTYGVIMFNRFGPVYDFAGSTGSVVQDPIWGTARATAKVGHLLIRQDVNGPDLFAFSTMTSGSNPFVPMAPNIDTFVDVTVDFGAPNKLRISGHVNGDAFPNLEVFIICYRSKNTALLMDGRTGSGPNAGPATRLWGKGKNNLLGTFASNLELDEKGQLKTSYICSPQNI